LQASPLLLSGTVIGLAVSLGFTKVMASFLFEVNAHDLSTFLLVPAALMTCSLVACYLPANSTIDSEPLSALRGQ